LVGIIAKIAVATQQRSNKTMKPEIHPDYHEVTAVCSCGTSFITGSTKKGDSLKVEICSKCHPFYTGKQKIVDTGGRIDKFNKRYQK